MALLEAGKTLQTDDGDDLVVGALLGAGGQGEVYAVTLRGQPMALKWVYPPGRDPRAQAAAQEQRVALRSYLIPKGPPDARFVWPLAFVEGARGSGSFGYVMRLWEPRFETLERLVCGRVPTGDRELATAALGIADAFRRLHLTGAVYKDINLGGFAFDPATGEVLVVDNDNVRTNGTPGAILFPGFGAPEVVMGRAPCTSQTDDHALAVLLFYLFCRGNPMEGAREMVNCYDWTATRSLYGDEALFVYHPTDEANRPVLGVHGSVIRNWATLPGSLQQAFTRAFTDGLTDPAKRLTDGEWVQEMAAFRDALYSCGSCGRETAYDRAMLADGGRLHCVWCKGAVTPPARMKIGKHVLMLSPKAQLFPHHLGQTADFSAPIADLAAHPDKPGVFGLRNLSKSPWSSVGKDGQPRVVEPGRSVSLRDGLVVRFGPVEGTVRAG